MNVHLSATVRLLNAAETPGEIIDIPQVKLKLPDLQALQEKGAVQAVAEILERNPQTYVNRPGDLAQVRAK
eukprot:9212442-Pyramimonas_sp.AAC.1